MFYEKQSKTRILHLSINFIYIFIIKGKVFSFRPLLLNNNISFEFMFLFDTGPDYNRNFLDNSRFIFNMNTFTDPSK